MKTITKKLVKATIISLSVLSFAACEKATDKATAGTSNSIRAEENAENGRRYLASKVADGAEATESNENEIETITVPVDSFEVPENFNEDWLLANTYPGDNVSWDYDFSGLADEEFSHSTLIVYLNEGVSAEEKSAFLKKFNAEVIYDYEIICGMAIKLSEEKTTGELEAIISEMEKESIVLSVQKDYIVHTTDGGSGEIGNFGLDVMRIN